MKLVAVGQSHIGKVRTKNDDSFLIGDQVSQSGPVRLEVDVAPNSTFLVAIADGMGGYAGGAFASQTILKAIAKGFTNLTGYTAGDFRKLVASAQAELVEASNGHAEFRESGTTLAAIAFLPDQRAVVFHVGDSRVLRAGGKYFRPLTVDHSGAGAMIARGELEPEAAAAIPSANALTRSLGVLGCPEPDIFETSYAPGDLYVLATDGLHGLQRGLSTEELEKLVGLIPDEFASEAIRRAVEQDGSDNATLITIAVSESEEG